MAQDLTPHPGRVTRADREARSGQRGSVVWLTGLSASGKSTLAYATEQALFERGAPCTVLDGDNVRRGLNSDLGFDEAGRRENIRRFGEVARLFADTGFITLVAVISPFRADRDRVRSRLEPGRFLEVFVDAPIGVCEDRDPKGLYRRARSGDLPEFTGISSPYEPPTAPDLVIPTHELDPDAARDRLITFLEESGTIPRR